MTADPRLQRALEHQRAGDPDRAEQLCRQILEEDPHNARALYLLGTLAAAAGRLDEAIGQLREAARLEPGFSATWLNLGNALLQRGAAREAEACFRRLADTGVPEGVLGIGRALLEQRRPGDAAAQFRQLLAQRPDFAPAHFQLGRALEQQGELPQAADCYREALRLNPGLLHVHTALGRVLRTLGRLDEAAAAFREIIRVKPEAADAWNNLGNVLRQQARMDEAADCYRRALSLAPQLAGAWNNLGNVLKTLGRLEEAVDSYRRALQLDPASAQTHSNLLLCLNYLPDLDEEQLLREHRRWAEVQAPAHGTMVDHGNAPDPERRLRIGYLSPDLRDHAVSRFFEPLLTHHDHEVVEVVCYAQLVREDDTSRRLKSLSDGWRRTVGVPDAELARRVRDDGIDILVDLAGHTARNRLPVLGLRPAPVQVSWLGYPNTTGLPAVDYRLGDAIADPAGAEQLYTERLVRLPGGLTRYRPPEDAPPPGPLPAHARDRLTFGSLNNLVKLNEAVIALWSRLLRALPRARLLLYRDMLRDRAAERLRAAFARHGIDQRQLELRHQPPADGCWLDVYREIDIALDPFPWNGHVTTCEALWMGVPVITLLGPVHRGRLSASVLHQVGLDELVADDADGYLQIAMALAGDRERLAQMRASMRQRVASSPLCDGAAMAREVEAAYREMWRNWCKDR